jgi:hypothetical protein
MMRERRPRSKLSYVWISLMRVWLIVECRELRVPAAEGPLCVDALHEFGSLLGFPDLFNGCFRQKLTCLVVFKSRKLALNVRAPITLSAGVWSTLMLRCG